MLSRRSRLSLCQLLFLQPRRDLGVLLRKHDIGGSFRTINELSSTLSVAEPVQLRRLLDELAKTQRVLMDLAPTKYQHRERWEDFTHCLLLDGYKVDNNRLLAIDPTIEGAEPLDDDLSTLLLDCDLPGADDVLELLENSMEAFRKSPPELNACLTDARVALQTTARAIAQERQRIHPKSYDDSKWGEVLKYLRESGFISVDEEKGLAGVFRFASPGAHRSVGANEVEMARLGRSFIIGMLYFLVKVYTDGDKG